MELFDPAPRRQERSTRGELMPLGALTSDAQRRRERDRLHQERVARERAEGIPGYIRPPETIAELCPYCHFPREPGRHGWVRRDLPADHPEFAKPTPLDRMGPGYVPCPACTGDAQAYQRAQSIEQLTTESRLPAYAADWHFSNFPRMAGKELARLEALAFATGEYTHAPIRTLHLYGGFGTGKTSLAVCIGKQRLAMLQSVRFWPVPDLFTALKATFAQGSGASEASFVADLVACDLLILDDLGGERPTPFQQEKLYQLLNGRMLAGHETVITSNLSLDDLSPALGERLVERIDYLYLPHEVGGVNLRRDRRGS